MVEEPKEPTRQEEIKKLRKGIKGDEKDKMAVIKQIATRDKLERDYMEDLLSVEFQSSSETRRMIKAKRPTQTEMMTIMKLSAEASIYEGKMDPDSLKRMVDIYDQLPKLASTLSTDAKLDEKFWKERVSFTTLQNFITELIKVTQQGPVSEEEMSGFR